MSGAQTLSSGTMNAFSCSACASKSREGLVDPAPQRLDLVPAAEVRPPGRRDEFPRHRADPLVNLPEETVSFHVKSYERETTPTS